MPDFSHLHLAHLAAPRTTDGRPVAPGQPAVFAAPSDAIRTLSFLSNLAAQEATGDLAASMSAELALHALCGTPEMLTDLFAVVSGPVPVGELSPLGYPLLASTGEIPELDYMGFIQLSRPQLEDLDNVELDCVLDAGYLPLPGTPLEPEAADLLAWMLDNGCELAQRLGRARVLTGMMHAPDDEVLPASLAEVFTRSRFSRRHAETQLVTRITEAGELPSADSPGLPGLPDGWQFAAFHNYDLPADIEPQVVELLTVASQDADYGEMTVEPVDWTADRLNEARRRVHERRSETVLVAAIDATGAARRVRNLVECGRHHGGHAEIAEWTLMVTDRGWRRQGLATATANAALVMARDFWPELNRVYGSAALSDVASRALHARLGSRPIAVTTAWQRDL
ncbi:GNAT family acetyltransferase [Corynebacterium sp. 32222D000AT]|nr:GNAT family acetyltransferase [Mycobacteriaceae bacterium]MDY5828559.1 GNAT family acetyltransferase [Corynebacterium sp.]